MMINITMFNLLLIAFYYYKTLISLIPPIVISFKLTE